jgi:DnaJ-class molecular chaperone
MADKKKQPKEEKKKVCPECHGGKLDVRVPAEDNKPCPNCGGTGKV